MQTLIIILIVVLIAQTIYSIYVTFIDASNKRQQAAAQELLTNQHGDFLREKENFQKILKARDETIKLWIDKVNKLDFELAEARKVNGLLKNRTFHIEGLKDSINNVAENGWDLHEYDPTFKDKTPRQCYAEGVKAGAEWIADCVGVKVKFELDGRFDEDDTQRTTE